MSLSAALRDQLSSLVANHRVVLFMKGTKTAPQCGFSAQVVQILDEHAQSYEAVDVLASPELREGIKAFSDWPTIPQLFIDGKFVGGSDIVRALHASGELQGMLGNADAVEPASATIELSPSARSALVDALGGASDDFVHLEIAPGFAFDLYLGPRAATDVEVATNGPLFLLDPHSLRRAGRVSVDFVQGPQGGFKISSSNEPVKVRELDPKELAQKLAENAIVLFDVRPDAERRIASIRGARPLDEEGQAYLLSLDRERAVAFHCHHGVRSRNAAERVLGEGFRNVFNLRGGIDAWSQTVDASVPRY